MDPLPFVEVLTEKVDNLSSQVKLKVRLAVRGDLQRNKPLDVFSLMAGHVEMRVFISCMKQTISFVVQCDCPSAYLNGDLEEIVYLFLPDGHPEKTENDEKVYRCPSSLYGLAVSGKVWYLKFKRVLESLGFACNLRAPTMFWKDTKEGRVYIILYVDDFLIGSNSSKAVDETLQALKEKFNVKYTWQVKKFVGMEIEIKGSALWLHQTKM